MILKSGGKSDRQKTGCRDDSQMYSWETQKIALELEAIGNTNVLWFTGSFLKAKWIVHVCAVPHSQMTPSQILSVFCILQLLEPAAKKPVMHYSASSFFMRTCRSHLRPQGPTPRFVFVFFCFFWWGGACFFWSSKSSLWLNNLQAVPKFI